MNVFFDVDFTLITWNERLRPHVREVFAALVDEGHAVYLWSGRGERWEIVERFGLDRWVSNCFAKPLYDHVSRLPELGVTVTPDYVVDDDRDPVRVFGGWLIAPAEPPLDGDEEMLRVHAAIRAHARTRERAS
jgi:hypothetical protein